MADIFRLTLSPLPESCRSILVVLLAYRTQEVASVGDNQSHVTLSTSAEAAAQPDLLPHQLMRVIIRDDTHKCFIYLYI